MNSHMSKHSMHFTRGVIAGVAVGVAIGMLAGGMHKPPAHPFRKKMNRAANIVGGVMDSFMSGAK